MNSLEVYSGITDYFMRNSNEFRSLFDASDP